MYYTCVPHNIEKFQIGNLLKIHEEHSEKYLKFVSHSLKWHSENNINIKSTLFIIMYN